jgi:hypothetical protein
LGSTHLVKVQEVEVKTTDGDEMSEVIYGCLKLKKPLPPVTLDPGSEDLLKMRQCIFRFTPDVADDPMEGNLYGTTCFYRSPDAITGKTYRDARGLV